MSSKNSAGSFDIKIVRDLTRLMRDNDLVEVEVESSELKVRLSKAGNGQAPVVVAPAAVPAAAPVAPAAAPAEAAAAPAPAENEFADCKEITSPIPGTVYLKPNPETPAYVKVGDSVDEGSIVCLVEAMKVFNEVKAEGLSGTIKKICVEDGQAVEFGTPLFLVG